MNTIIENIKKYFLQKSQGQATGDAPEGMCPDCWGFNEWEGHYFELVRDKHLTPGKEIYQSFISKIADKHVKTTHKHKNKYVCKTCDKEIV